MRTKLAYALATSAVAAMTITGCSTGNEPAATQTGSSSAAAAGGDCVLGMSQINQTAAFFTQMNEGVEEAAKAAGCKVTIANANNDSAKQNSDIESFVTQKVTGLIVVAIDVNGVGSAINAAKQAGIKVVAIDGKLPDGVADTFVGVDNDQAGAQIGEWATQNGFGSGVSYGVVDARNSFIQNQREDSFRKVVDAAGAKYSQSVSGDNVQEKAATAAQNLLTAQPDLGFIYTTGEPATVGAVSAVSATAPTKIIGWDLTAEAIKGIDSGSVAAVVQQDPKQEGVEAVNELKAIAGGAAPKGTINVPVTIVTKANVEPYRAIFQ